MNAAHRLFPFALGALVFGLASCQALGIGDDSQPSADEPGAVAGAAVSATASVDLTALALSATPSPTTTPGTPTATPTITPTPTATPTPIPPGQAVRPSAVALATKLSTFRTALTARNVEKLSTAQVALLDEADRAESAIAGDKSPEADLVREAIADIRGGAGGQTKLLDSAAMLLNQVGAGGGLSPTVVAGQEPQDLATLSETLSEAVQGYQQARRERNSENLLKRQSDLITALDAVATATQNDESAQAKQLRSAAAGLRSALSGTNGQPAIEEDVTAALAQVQTVVGGISASAEGQADGQPTDIEARSDSLRRIGISFRSALAAGNRSETARLQRDLLDEIARAESALQAAPDPSSGEAESLRVAIGSLREGASGDLAKLDSGLNALNASSTGNQTATASIVDVKKTAESLQSKLASLQKAARDGASSDELRLQRELYDEATKIEPLLQNDTSKEADALRGAIGAIKSGVAGETGKLDEADRQLRTAAGKPAGPLTSLTPTAPSADLTGASSALAKRLGSLEAALQSNDPDAVATAEQDLAAEADRVIASLQGQRSEEADRLRGAATAAREAARGDPSKLQSAIELLRGESQ